MVLLLILNVANDGIQLRMSVSECSVSFLPVEPPVNPFFLIDVVGRVRFNLPDKVRKSHRRSEANQDVDVVRRAIDCDQFLALILNNARDVLVDSSLNSGLISDCLLLTANTV